MTVPCYPDFVPLSIELKDSLHPRLSLTSDGVSEFTFSGLYLFRNKYNYRISRDGLPDGGFIISGESRPDPAGVPAQQPSPARFFMTPCASPSPETLDNLFSTHDYWKNISENVLNPVKEKLEDRGFVFTEDRDNSDYLYLRNDLAELAGKKYHKKKNHVNNFLTAYPNHTIRPMSAELVPDALEVLEQWRINRINMQCDEGDHKSAKEALELFNALSLRGAVFYIDGKPAAYCLGESLARGKMFAIHFEKAIDGYKGIYQFVNQAFAASLPRFFTLINREQDLGNEGLRQAKMTYRPCSFVVKYTGVKS